MRRLAPLALGLASIAAAPATVPTPPAPRGFFADGVAAQQKVEREFRAIPDPAVARETMRRLAAAPHHLGSPAGAKNAEWILAKFREWGLEAQDRDLRRSLPDPEGARRRARRALPLSRRARRDHSQGGPHLRPDRAAASDLQRLLDRRRRDRAARLRELRRPRRLRAARAPGRRREGQDRHRALRRRLAGHQAQGRGRERRRRLHHLLGPEGRRLFRGRGLPEGPVPPRAGRAARQRRGHAGPLGRPADPGRGRHEGRPAHRPQGRRHDHEDPGAADLLRRCQAAARRPRGPGRPGELARGPADHLSHRPGAREGPPQARVRLEARAGQRRHRDDPRRRLAGRVDRPRQPPRCLGQRRRRPDLRPHRPPRGGPRLRAAPRKGMAPEAHDHSLCLGRRGAGPSRLDRMGRGARRRSCARRPWRTSTPTGTAAGS